MASLIQLMQMKVAKQEQELGPDHPYVKASKQRLADMQTRSAAESTTETYRLQAQVRPFSKEDPAEAILRHADSQREAKSPTRS